MGDRSGGEFTETPLGCWEWRFATTGAGYGARWMNGKVVLAHRAYYEEFIGPIPEGLEIDHLCRNTRCVNPGHLEAVTHQENILRGKRRSHCKHGHLYTPANSYIRPNGHRMCRECMRAHDRRRAPRRRKAAA